LHKIDRALDKLRVSGLIETGFHLETNPLVATIEPTALMLYFYIKTQRLSMGDIKLLYHKNL
jgi:hypothetical protein